MFGARPVKVLVCLIAGVPPVSCTIVVWLPRMGVTPHSNQVLALLTLPVKISAFNWAVLLAKTDPEVVMAVGVRELFAPVFEKFVVNEMTFP